MMKKKKKIFIGIKKINKYSRTSYSVVDISSRCHCSFQRVKFVNSSTKIFLYFKCRFLFLKEPSVFDISRYF